MKTFLALVKDEPTMQKLYAQNKAEINQLIEQADFLFKKLKQLTEKADSSRKLYWDGMISVCRSKNLLPENFSDDKMHFHIDSGVLFLCSEEHDNGPLEFLKKLMK